MRSSVWCVRVRGAICGAHWRRWEMASSRRASTSPCPPLDRHLPSSHAAQARSSVREAGQLGEALQAWLDGAQQRAEAVELVERALQQVPRMEALERQARQLRQAARDGLVALPPWASVGEKAPFWEMEDAAADAAAGASLLALEKEMLLHSSLTRVASLPMAHAALAALYHSVHRQTERRRQGSARVEALLRRHALALPRDHPDRKVYIDYLDGQGLLSLRTEPAGATVRLYRYEESERMLVPQDQGTLGVTPLERVAIEAGSYLCVLTHPDCAPAAYPVHIARQAHWTGDLPDVESPRPVTLVEGARLDPGAQYVPGARSGWGHTVAFRQRWRIDWCGSMGLPSRPPRSPMRSIWSFSTTHWVDGLRWVPRERPNPRGEPGSLLIARRGDGRFYLTIDPDGDEWRPQMPDVYVDYAAACAYALWLSAKTGHAWRLPTEIEWRKACQGVDGRPYPWGWVAEPTRAQNLLSGPPRQVLTDVGSFPEDCSPYGVLDMGGNCQQWTLDSESSVRLRLKDGHAVMPQVESGASRLVCGVAWHQQLNLHARTSPHQQPLTGRSGGLGFRLVYSLPTDPA